MVTWWRGRGWEFSRGLSGRLVRLSFLFLVLRGRRVRGWGLDRAGGRVLLFVDRLGRWGYHGCIRGFFERRVIGVYGHVVSVGVRVQAMFYVI